ncbi:aspartate/glutamate racemase family protein [archaeon]|nr:aspartate/glutamate racemase family protein [archaeon]NCQ50433.1 aspartate/glutamate racemase family protein [archaeon]
MKKLGIIGGAGAFSGLNIYKKILYGVARNRNLKDKDFPQILLHNYPFSSISSKGVDLPTLAKQEIELALKPLIECAKIIIACNSLNPLVSDSRIINLPQLGLIHYKTRKKQNDKVLILCSKTSKEHNIFSEDSDIIYSSNELSELSELIIQNHIVGNTSNELDYFHAILTESKKQDITNIIVGCTELSMLNWNKLSSYINVIDCVDLAVQEFVLWHNKEQNESL